MPSVVKKVVNLCLGAACLLSVTACAGAIKIERIPTPTATAPPLSAPTVTSPTWTGGAPQRIVAAKISLDAPIVEMGWSTQAEGEQTVSVWNVPENEAGWHLNSARPGQGSNVVISGHNDSTGGRVFAELESLEVGDSITLWVDDETAYTYTVSETQIVRAFGASPETLDYLRAVTQPTTTEQLTLITCWPSWTNTHRLIVIAHPV